MTIERDFSLTDNDKEILIKLKDFIPEKIFDMHTHLYNSVYCPNMTKPGLLFYEFAELTAKGGVVDRESFMRFQVPLYNNAKQIRLNVISMPDASMTDLSNGNRAGSNEFLVRHLEQNSGDVGEAMVLANDKDEDIKNLLVHPSIRGFKCYHLTAARKPTWQAEIDEYLPESAWRAADDSGLCITLHMVKDDALADPGNIKNISEKTRKYPSANLILAHAARGFAPWTAIEGVKRLSDFTNIYFDLSAVCEPTAMMAVIKAVGSDRVFWGSDFPASMMRGKCVSIGASFNWLYGAMLEPIDNPAPVRPALVGVENLFAFWQASELLDLSRDEIEGIFYYNAMKLFRLED